MKYAIHILIILLCGACASNRTKTLLGMGVMGLGGAAIGAATTPPSENAAGHALLWGGVAAAAGAVLGLFVFDEEKKSDELSRQNDILKKSLEALNDSGLGGNPKLLYETQAPFGKEVPHEYQNLIKPGRWSVYGLNQWIVQEENTLVHQDKMMKLLPPEFSPNVHPQEEKESKSEEE